MPAPRIPRGMARLIDSRVDDVFERLAVRLLGHAFTGKHLNITTEHGLTLPGIFEAAVHGEGGTYADRDLLVGIAEVAKDYLDKHRAEAKAATKRRIQSLLYDVESGRVKPEHFRNHVERELSELWARVRNNVERVVEVEAEHAQTIGVKEGIDQVNANLGIDDPIVCFIPTKDDKVCDECRRLHMLRDGITPRVWRSSEVSTDYHQRGENVPSWHKLHPHCRCALTTVMPGFGFKNGRITFIAFGHDEWQHQHAMEKSEAEAEAGEPLEKMRRGVVDQMLAANEWTFEREGGDHQIYGHPSIPHKLALKHSHAKEVPEWWVREYGKQAGLRLQNNVYVPNPNDPEHAQHYQARGKLAGPPPRVTWTPDGPHEHVAVGDVEHVLPPEQILPHKVMQLRATQAKKPWGAVKAMRYGGRLMPVDDAAEHLLAAAKSAGMTHVPVHVVESD